jgi:hypothetical protein
METAWSTQHLQDLRLDTSIRDFGANTISRDNDGVSLHIQSSEGGRNFGAQFPDDNKYSGSEITSGLNSELKVDEHGVTPEVGGRSPISLQASSIDDSQLNRPPSINFDPHVSLDSDHYQSMDEPIQGPTKVGLDSEPIGDEHGITVKDGGQSPTNLQTSFIDDYVSNRPPSTDFDPQVTLDSDHHQSMDEPIQNPAKVGLNSEFMVDGHGTTAEDERQSHTNLQASSIDNCLSNGETSINFDPHVILNSSNRQDADEPLQNHTNVGLNSESVVDEHGTTTEDERQSHTHLQASSIDNCFSNGETSIDIDPHVILDSGNRQDVDEPELMVGEHGSTTEDGRQSPTNLQASSIDNHLSNGQTLINFDPHITLNSGNRQNVDEPLQNPTKVGLNSALMIDEHRITAEDERPSSANLPVSPINNRLFNRWPPINLGFHVSPDPGHQNMDGPLQNPTKVGLDSKSMADEHGIAIESGRQSPTTFQASSIDKYLLNGRPSINFDFHVTPDPTHQNMDGPLQNSTKVELDSESMIDGHSMTPEGERQSPINFQASSIDKYLLNGRPSINFGFHAAPDAGHQNMDERSQKPVNIRLNTESMIGEHDITTEDGRKSRPISQAFSIDDYLSTRRPSINFDPHVTLDSGHRQSMDEPLHKPAKVEPRGRSLLHAISDKRSRSHRAHSESDLTHYDTTTGEPLPKYAEEMGEKLQPHIGELRHPLLQSTVDELARESQPDLTIPGISQSATSPSSDDDRTPQDKRGFFLSPTVQSPAQYPASYEETTPWQRSRRGIDRARTPELSRRMESMRSALRQPSRRSTSSSAKSPRSAASSWLRGFSLSSGPASPVDATFSASEGQTVGDDYVLGRQIGFGGFSTIHEVTQMMPAGGQRKLAAKIVRKSVKDKSPEENEQFQAEFAHEVELWRLLHHRHILPLETVWHTDEATYCFIPLNRGGTLFDLVRSNRSGVPIDLAKRYSYQLAVALRYLHCDARVAHRDVKLENCLLDTTSDPGEVRLCDFGMAEWISNDRYSSRSGPPSPVFNSVDRQRHRNIGPAETSSLAFAGGSLDYAAPETLRAAMSNTLETAPISPAVDIWAYGVCVYTMVVGSRPFYHSFRPRISAAILSGDWDREKLLEKGGQDAFDLVQNCLEIDPDRRWDTDEVLGCAWLKEIADANDDQDHSFSSTWKL